MRWRKVKVLSWMFMKFHQRSIFELKPKYQLCDQRISWILSDFEHFITIGVLLLNVIWKAFCDKVLQNMFQSIRLLKIIKNNTWDHSFSTYAKFCEKLTFLTSGYAHVCVRIRGEAYQGIRNVTFTENFVDVLDEWSPWEILYYAPSDN